LPAFARPMIATVGSLDAITSPIITEVVYLCEHKRVCISNG
jgi:hypothetical protein